MMETNRHYKVIILGAGPAGVACALFLKKYNVTDVLVIDKNNHNVHKACSGILTERAIDLLKEINVDVKNYKKWDGVSAYYNNEYVTTYNSNEAFAYQNIGLNRISLDEELHSALKKEKIALIENVNNIVINYKTNEVNNIKYDYLIDARGYSILANKKKYKIIGVEAKISCDKNYEKLLSPNIYLSNNIKGYGWLVRYDKFTTIGFTDLYKNNYDLYGKLKEFTNDLHILLNEEDCDIRAAFLPIKAEKKIVSKNVLLIGDRAGICDPLTQEGIFYALYSAKCAALSISDSSTKEYKILMEKILKSLNRATLYRSIFFKRAFQKKLWNVSQRHKFTNFVFSKYSTLDFFDYTEIFSYHKEYKNNYLLYK